MIKNSHCIERFEGPWDRELALLVLKKDISKERVRIADKGDGSMS